MKRKKQIRSVKLREEKKKAAKKVVVEEEDEEEKVTAKADRPV